jgi:hypothetical protein
MSNETKKQATAAKKSAATNMPPRQVKRAEPIAPSAQTTAKPPAPVQRPKPLARLMSTTALDDFSGFNEEIEGSDRPQGGSTIQGVLLKFTAEAEWVTGSGDAWDRARELILIGLLRLVQKWIDGKPVEKIIVPPGEKFPDVDAMNEAAPKSEWRENFNGEMVGPWQRECDVYLLDVRTLDQFTFPTSTIGGTSACRELAKKVAWMHEYKGPNVSAVVTLADTFMSTRFGGRQRPHFNIVRWVAGFSRCGNGDGDKALPEPTDKSGNGGCVVETTTSDNGMPWEVVEEPSLREELNDDLPDSLK